MVNKDIWYYKKAGLNFWQHFSQWSTHDVRGLIVQYVLYSSISEIAPHFKSVHRFISTSDLLDRLISHIYHTE